MNVQNKDTLILVVPCRICLEEDSTYDFITPCECSGTLSNVHRKCLSIWLATIEPDDIRSIKCEICHTNYLFETNYSYKQYLCKFIFYCSYYICFIIQIGTLMLFSLLPNLYNFNEDIIKKEDINILSIILTAEVLISFIYLSIILYYNNIYFKRIKHLLPKISIMLCYSIPVGFYLFIFSCIGCIFIGFILTRNYA